MSKLRAENHEKLLIQNSTFSENINRISITSFKILNINLRKDKYFLKYNNYICLL